MDSVTAAHPALRGLRETLYDNARLVNTASEHMYTTQIILPLYYTPIVHTTYMCVYASSLLQ